MSRPVCLVVLLLALAVPASARAAENDKAAQETAVFQTLEKLNLSSMTGQSPWLVMCGRGVYQYFTTPSEQRGRLGLTAHPAVFGTLAVVLLLIAVKDSLLTFLGPFKVPLDVLAELLHAAGGAAGYVYLADVAFTPKEAAEIAQAIGDTLAFAAPPSETPATTPSAGSWVWAAVSFVMMCVVHTTVWIVFNSIEVAIILNPFPLVDTALKAFRTALIGLITGASAIHPVLGFLIALPIFLGSVALLPFALRLATVGWMFCFDILKRWFGAKEPTGRIMAFASWSLSGVTIFRLGEVTQAPDGSRAFTFRRFGWLWRKSVPLPADVYVGIGTLSPVLLTDSGGSTRQLLMFPPRYDRREQALAARLGISRVENVSLRAGLRWIIRRLFGKREPQPA